MKTLLTKIYYFVFPGEEGRALDKQFVQEFPDAKPFFEGRLETFRPIGTINDLTPYNRYGLLRFIEEITFEHEHLQNLLTAAQKEIEHE